MLGTLETQQPEEACVLIKHMRYNMLIIDSFCVDKRSREGVTALVNLSRV